jgi:predicted kinase
MKNKPYKPFQGAKSRKNLILVAGLPGAGKTTVSKILNKHLRGVHLELDEPKRKIIPREVMHRCASEGKTSPYPLLLKVYQHACNELSNLVENSDEKPEFIIIDECFHLKEFRDMLFETGESLGYTVWFVNVVCSNEDIVTSRLTGDKKREQKHVLEGQALNMRQAFVKVFEPIAEREYYIVDTISDQKRNQEIDAFPSLL